MRASRAKCRTHSAAFRRRVPDIARASLQDQHVAQSDSRKTQVSQVTTQVIFTTNAFRWLFEYRNDSSKPVVARRRTRMTRAFLKTESSYPKDGAFNDFSCFFSWKYQWFLTFMTFQTNIQWFLVLKAAQSRTRQWHFNFSNVKLPSPRIPVRPVRPVHLWQKLCEEHFTIFASCPPRCSSYLVAPPEGDFMTSTPQATTISVPSTKALGDTAYSVQDIW